MQSPSLFVKKTLTEILQQNNITLNGKIKLGKAKYNATLLAEHQSKHLVRRDCWGPLWGAVSPHQKLGCCRQQQLITCRVADPHIIDGFDEANAKEEGDMLHECRGGGR